MHVRRFLSLVLAAAFAACGDTAVLDLQDVPAPDYGISDAASGGNAHFHFLPPIAKNPSYSGIFDGTLSPVVVVEQLDENEEVVAVLGQASAVLDADDELYQMNWHTNEYDLSEASMYRLSIQVDGYEVGFADVHMVENGASLRDVQSDESIGLVHGRTLPVKFRIEEGWRPEFYLADNGVTIMCPLAEVGSTGVVNRVEYTKRSRQGIAALVAAGKSSGDYSPLATTCTSGVTQMAFMFYSAAAFNEDIGGWDVSSVRDMRGMFNYADSFNQDIGGWDVSSVTNMRFMFEHAEAFDQDVGGWDVGKVEDMLKMFGGALAFNGDIGGWDVSSVTNMFGMFNNTFFNQDIGGWDVSSVTDMRIMFLNATAFNQDLGGWCVSNIPTEPFWFDHQASAWTLDRPIWGTCPGG